VQWWVDLTTWLIELVGPTGFFLGLWLLCLPVLGLTVLAARLDQDA